MRVSNLGKSAQNVFSGLACLEEKMEMETMRNRETRVCSVPTGASANVVHIDILNKQK